MNLLHKERKTSLNCKLLPRCEKRRKRKVCECEKETFHIYCFNESQVQRVHCALGETCITERWMLTVLCITIKCTCSVLKVERMKRWLPLSRKLRHQATESYCKGEKKKEMKKEKRRRRRKRNICRDTMQQYSQEETRKTKSFSHTRRFQSSLVPSSDSIYLLM